VWLFFLARPRKLVLMFLFVFLAERGWWVRCLDHSREKLELLIQTRKHLETVWSFAILVFFSSKNMD